MSNEKQALAKTALDAEAEKYWEAYYKDSGYGKLWTREIPKRVQAELEKKQAKTASAGNSLPAPTIRPLATVITDKAVTLEGLAVYGQGDARRLQAFTVDFSHDGEVTGFEAVAIQ